MMSVEMQLWVLITQVCALQRRGVGKMWGQDLGAWRSQGDDGDAEKKCTSGWHLRLEYTRAIGKAAGQYFRAVLCTPESCRCFMMLHLHHKDRPSIHNADVQQVLLACEREPRILHLCDVMQIYIYFEDHHTQFSA